MASAGLIFLVLILLIVIAAGAYVFYTRFRASRAGLPPPPLSSYNPFSRTSNSPYPSPAPTSILDWVKDKFHNLKNSRTAGGAYEEPLGRGAGSGRGRRGFGPLDPDEAWDSRVGNEADAYGAGGYYEEQELGLHPVSNNTGAGYSGGGYGGEDAALPEYDGGERGRSRSRDPADSTAYVGGSQRGLDARYDEATGKGNPFGDEAESSDLRGVSPRPVEGRGHKAVGSVGNGEAESAGERRSMFHENM
ncbi:hypothetical protein MMC08_006394 [Hypocenomyce scalaris]|nr:hypothetical protein [Hypocenomyce scalaris]